MAEGLSHTLILVDCCEEFCSRPLCRSRYTVGNLLFMLAPCGVGVGGCTRSKPIVVSVAIARGKHPVPFRTRKLSLSTPMVLQAGACGRLCSRRTFNSLPPDGGRELLHSAPLQRAINAVPSTRCKRCVHCLFSRDTSYEVLSRVFCVLGAFTCPGPSCGVRLPSEHGHADSLAPWHWKTSIPAAS